MKNFPALCEALQSYSNEITGIEISDKDGNSFILFTLTNKRKIRLDLDPEDFGRFECLQLQIPYDGRLHLGTLKIRTESDVLTITPPSHLSSVYLNNQEISIASIPSASSGNNAAASSSASPLQRGLFIDPLEQIDQAWV